jgi:hypothetical protein
VGAAAAVRRPPGTLVQPIKPRLRSPAAARPPAPATTFSLAGPLYRAVDVTYSFRFPPTATLSASGSLGSALPLFLWCLNLSTCLWLKLMLLYFTVLLCNCKQHLRRNEARSGGCPAVAAVSAASLSAVMC